MSTASSSSTAPPTGRVAAPGVGPARRGLWFGALGVVLLGLIVASLFVGPYRLSVSDLLADPQALMVFLASRVPRTAALVLCGVSLSVAGLIMQLITQNKFVEPSTAGTMQSAGLGILVMTIFWPGAPVAVRMIMASAAAFAGTMLFMAILRRVAWRNSLIVPLIGIMLGAVIGAAVQFVAQRLELQQTLEAWAAGSFSDILRGRYELLWIVGGLAVVTYLVADRMSVAGLGEDVATNVGLNYRAVVMLGSTIVALVAGITVSVVGVLPFLGLIVPNIVSLTLGDNARRSIPWVCLLGAAIIVACDILSRTLVSPAEIPVGTILGILGGAVFLFLILRQTRHDR